MAIKAAIWTHGHGVEPERAGAWLNTSRPGWGAIFKTGGGSHWFHFHFSVPVILNDQRLKLMRAFVMFAAKNNATVEALHIYDGRRRSSLLTICRWPETIPPPSTVKTPG